MELLWRSPGVSSRPRADPSATNTRLRRARRQSGEQARPRRGLREAPRTTHQIKNTAQVHRPAERTNVARLLPRQSPKRPIGGPEAIPALRGPTARPQPTHVGHPGCNGAPRRDHKARGPTKPAPSQTEARRESTKGKEGPTKIAGRRPKKGKGRRT